MRHLWAAPLTLIGLFLLLLSGGQSYAEWDARHGAEWRVPRNPWWWPERFVGMCIGDILMVRTRTDIYRTMLTAHELEHREQCWHYGPLLLVLYPLACLVGWLVYRKPYRGNVFEIAARAAAGEEVEP